MTKKIILVLVLTLLLPLFSIAQCKEFAKNEGLPLLGPYTQSGRYHALLLYEGEQIKMYKTLTKGIDYRFILSVGDGLPQNTNFIIMNWKKEIIFDNAKNDFDKLFDYSCQKSQRVLIVVKVPRNNNSEKEKSACVSLITGFKKTE